MAAIVLGGLCPAVAVPPRSGISRVLVLITRCAFLLRLVGGDCRARHECAPVRTSPGSPARAGECDRARQSAEDATRYAGVITQYCASCHNGRAADVGHRVRRDLRHHRSAQRRPATRRCGRRWCGSCAPAPCRRRACRIRMARRRGPPVVARAAPRRSGGHAQPRPSGAPPSESHRVPERHSRSARARHRRRLVAAAARRLGLRLRQDRRLPRRVADAARALSLGRRPHQRARGGRRSTSCPAPRPTPPARICRRTSTSTACRSAPSAASRPPTRSRWTATTCCRRRSIRTNVDETRGLEHPHQVEIAVDGERVFLQTIGGTPPGNPGGVDEAGHRPRPSALALRRDRRQPAGAGAREGGSARSSPPRSCSARARRTRASCSRIAARSTPTTRPAMPHIRDAHRQGAVHGRRAGRHAEPRPHLHLPPGDAGAGRAVRAPDSDDAGAARLSAAGRRPRT